MMIHMKWSLVISIVAWLLAGGIYLVIRYFGTGEVTDWSTSNLGVGLLWFFGSVSFGVGYWIVQNVTDTPKFRKISYSWLIILKVFCLVLLSIMIIVGTRLTAFWVGNIESQQILSTFMIKLLSVPTGVFLAYVLIVSTVFTLIRQMNWMLGPRLLGNILMGRYHSPQQEERIFLFLDLKSSVTHAEKMGHQLFSRLIQTAFRDLTDAVLKTNAEVHQYTGDGAIITWTIQDGIENANCLKFYGHFDGIIQKKRNEYLKNFSLVPEFKAGVHLGTVTSAEIGVLKRDIAFHGDAINTAARIQAKCSELGHSLLISKQLFNSIKDFPEFKSISLGNFDLKGKAEPLEIFSVQAP